MTKLELRQIDVELSGVKEESGDLLVSGYVNQTGQWSQPLGRENRFIERIEPGTFTRALQRGNDVHFLAEHDNAKLLASTKNGSLQLREDDKGLFMEARISPTTWGKDYHQLIQDGLLTNMSFGMQVAKDKWDKRDDGTYQRTISDLHLAEVSVVRNPAYVQSSIQARSIEVIETPVFFMKKNNKKEKEDVEMSKEKQLKELRAQMEAMEAEVRAEQETAQEVEVREVEVDPTEAELRGVEQFLKGDIHGAEVRTMTTGTGAITVPTSLSNVIVEKLVEEAALFGRAKGFTPVSGTLEVLREKSIGNATFVGEMDPAQMSDFEFDKITLEQRRAATAIELSQQLVNDSGIDVVNYAVNVMTRRLARKLDETVLNGDPADKQFEGILTSGLVDVVGTHQADKISIDNLLDMTLAVHPDHLQGSVFVMGRPAFNQVAKLKDVQGNYHMVKDVVNGKPVYKIFGHEILIQDKMPKLATGAISVVFINFAEAYATMIKKGAQMKRISDDTTQALRGTHLLMLDIYCDGKILNEDAIKFLKQA
ncbi:phage major capsid protein [Bacillus nitratireducens]|uniref:phage major capsid protein n=1 Tax=Bacillus nitratireducens TaxID=2026193 RepID=UPI0008995989|nr:phage major capsid protein [Bacillus nitratireducens]SEA91316.1 phage prohead protease, HK97 family/phage major capsid protein, HK97 family,TIGR01554 [Bacillus nitratireducens]